LGEEDDAAAGLSVEEPAVNSRPIKRTNRQTSFQEEATKPCRHRRHERIADHLLPNANYLYSPLAIKMCRAWTGAEEEGAISAVEGTKERITISLKRQRESRDVDETPIEDR